MRKQKKRRTPFWLLLALLAAFFLAACGPAQPAEDNENEATDAIAAQEEDTEDESAADAETDAADAADAAADEAATDTEASAEDDVLLPNEPEIMPEEVDEGEFTTTESGLKYFDLIEGDGAMPESGDIATIDYAMWLQEGTQFIDSSMGDPVDFILGSSQVFPGWNEGVLGMMPGGKRQLIIPPDLALGEEGLPGLVPPDSTIVLEVELIEFRSSPKPAEVDEADYTTTESGLQIFDIEEGEGATPEDGDTVTMNFNTWLQEDNQFVNGSEEIGEPLSIVLGQGEVFPGWEEALRTMSVGGVRQVVVPPDLGLGEAGVPGVIPPNATLILELELLDVTESPEPTAVDEEDYTVTESGLKYYDLEEGDGATPEEGQIVTVHYTGWLEDGIKFDSSLDRGAPFEFVLGSGGVIPGWEEGVTTMQVGDKRQLVIPPELAYGESGAGARIPPNATLIFEIELLAVDDQ